MGLNVNTNIMSLNAQRHLDIASKGLESSISKLSSGLRINKAGDDAAGLAISEHLKAQIRGLGMCQRNASDGISLVQTAEGVLNTVHSALSRMRELALQSANGTYGTAERGYLQDEFTALMSEIDRIAERTEFNGQGLLDGSLATGMAFQVGLHSVADDRIVISIPDAHTSSIGTDGGPSVASQAVDTVTAALQCLSVIDDAIADVSRIRGGLGSVQNRLQYTIDNIMIMRNNLSAANSQIRDADIAVESSELTRSQILTQSATAMVAQANGLPNLALQLLQG